jgi:hypothetical protein
MQDYFSEFLLRKNPIGAFASWLGDDSAKTAPPSTVCGSNLKLHLIWAAVTIAIVVTTWKISKWHASYQFIQQQVVTNQSTLPVKTA